jgi:hypothetical protein
MVLLCMLYVVARRLMKNDRRLSPLWMVMGGLPLLLWFGVGIAGRAIAFI